jgi:thiamine biosynthesis protein ThiI
MKNVILVRYGEIVLKGLNRPLFEDILIKNIKKSLLGMGKINIVKSQARIFIEPEDGNYDYISAIERLRRVFGIVSVSHVKKTETDFETIKKCSIETVRKILKSAEYKSFKVETKRGQKNFPMKSPEVSAELGGVILDNFPGLTVDVIKPDFILYIEIRENTYIYSEKIQAFGGMPQGTNGKAVLLISGGIDSPVAGWMMAKRGVEISAVHFYSYPYTSERAKQKVIDLTKILASYSGEIDLYIVPFTEIQMEINDKCPHDQMTVIMRRAMMQIAERIANSNGAQALITGESMGQVASQTIQSLVATDNAVNMPVFRPLIGMDKNEIVDIAKKIKTFETSILPYEDCCTVFISKHPKTKPILSAIIECEALADLSGKIDIAVESAEKMTIKR